MSDAIEFPRKYLGDGVYASFDGFQIWLHVGSHLAPGIVALEPEVMHSLNEYDKEIKEIVRKMRAT